MASVFFRAPAQGPFKAVFNFDDQAITAPLLSRFLGQSAAPFIRMYQFLDQVIEELSDGWVIQPDGSVAIIRGLRPSSFTFSRRHRQVGGGRPPTGTSRPGSAASPEPGGPHRRNWIIGAAGVLVAAGAGAAAYFKFLTPTAEKPPIPRRPPVLHAPLPPFDNRKSADPEYVRQYFKTAVLHFGKFSQEIERLDLLPGYTREALSHAVDEFLSFLDRAVIAPPLSMAPNMVLGVERANNIFRYNPNAMNQWLPLLDMALFHEIVHFSEVDHAREGRIPVLVHEITPFISQHIRPDILQDMQRRGRTQIGSGEILEKNLWVFESLNDRPDIQDKFAEMLQLQWQREVDSYYYQIALLASQTDGSAGALTRLLESRPMVPSNNVEEDLRQMGQAFRPGIPSRIGIEIAFGDFMDNRLFLNFFSAVRKARTGEDFTPASLERMRREPLFRGPVMTWSIQTILLRPLPPRADAGPQRLGERPTRFEFLRRNNAFQTLLLIGA